MNDLNELKAMYMECYSKMLTCPWIVVSVWQESRELARQNLRDAGLSAASIRSLEKMVCKEINHEWVPEDE